MAGDKKWTDQQRQAIETQGTSLVVSAAAGSGKTAVLTERVFRRITDPERPVDVDRLLVVTFTNEAAGEMRERIRQKLEQGLQQEGLSPQGQARLRRQLALLNHAFISTIHSFCRWVIQRNFYRLNLDPAFRVLEEAEADLLKQEALSRCLEQAYARQPAGGPFYRLLSGLGSPDGRRVDAALGRWVIRVHDFARSLPDPEGWLGRVVAQYRIPDGVSFDDLPWASELRASLVLRLEHLQVGLREACRITSLPGGPAAYQERFGQELDGLTRVLEAARAREPWDRLREGLAALESQMAVKVPQVRKHDADPALKDRAKALRDDVKKAIRSLQAGVWGRETAQLVDELRALEPQVAAFVDLVQRFAQEYYEAKRLRLAVDFSDLEQLCLRVLTGNPQGAPKSQGAGLSPAAAELQERFEEVLVDEFQDVNPVQEAILRAVCRGQGTQPGNLFVVGDVKQSIYRFRLADPTLFLRLHREYQEGVGGVRIDLQTNFRSRQAVIDGVNFLFRQVLSESVGELDYDRQAELVRGAQFGGPDLPVELHLIERGSAPGTIGGPTAEAAAASEAVTSEAPSEAAAEDAPEGELGDSADSWAMEAGGEKGGLDESGSGSDAPSPEELEALEREAWVVARRIRRMVEGERLGPGDQPVSPEQVWDPKIERLRPIRYRDVVVLLRSMKDRANQILEVFSRAGVPAHAHLGTGYFKALEVQTVLALLQVLDNPRQDIPLAALLRSPVVGLGATELAQVRLCDPEGDLYSAVVAAASPGSAVDDGLRQTLAQLLERVERWRTAARRSPLSAVIEQIYRETGLVEHDAATPGGEQREANLLALVERARQFDRFAQRGLFRFLRFLERLQEHDADLGPPPVLAEGQDAVRVMSIHKSKGLEFPVVFVMDLGKQFNLKDLQGNLIYHRQLGLGLPTSRWHELGLVRQPSAALVAVRLGRRREALAEELRILYVALTRARERLILVGSADKMGQRLQRWLATGLRPEGWTLPAAALASAQTPLDWILPAIGRHPAAEELWKAAGLDPEAADERVPEPVRRDPSRWAIRLWRAGTVEALQGAGPAETALRAGDEALTPGAAAQDSALAPAPGSVASPPAADVLERIRRLEALPEELVPEELAVQVRAELETRFGQDDDEDRVWSGLFAKSSVTELKRRYEAGWEAGEVPAEWTAEAAESLPAGAPAQWPQELAARRAAGAPTAVPAWAPAEAAAAGEVVALGQSKPTASAAGPWRLRSEPYRRPRFIGDAASEKGTLGKAGGDGLTAAEVGTATHRVLQHLDLKAPLDQEAEIQRQIDGMVKDQLLTLAQARAVPVVALVRFFRSALGRQVLEAARSGAAGGPTGARARLARAPGATGRVIREISFTLGLPAREVYPGVSGQPEVPVLLQGAIDCLVDGPDGLTMIDFKTDTVEGPAIEQRAKEYRVQLALYARAVGEILRRPVRHAYLYFLQPGVEVEVPVDQFGA